MHFTSSLKSIVLRVPGARHSVGIPTRHLLCFWSDCAESPARPSFSPFSPPSQAFPPFSDAPPEMRLVEWMQVLDKEEMPLSRRQKLIMAVGGALFGNNAAARQSKVILEMKINIFIVPGLTQRDTSLIRRC